MHVVLSLGLLTPPGHCAPSLVQQLVHIPAELSASPQGSAGAGCTLRAGGELQPPLSRLVEAQFGRCTCSHRYR